MWLLNKVTLPIWHGQSVKFVCRADKLVESEGTQKYFSGLLTFHCNVDKIKYIIKEKYSISSAAFTINMGINLHATLAQLMTLS